MKISLSVLLFCLMLLACRRGESDPSRQLTVSIEPQRYLLEQIAGDSWTVNTLLTSGEDPENFDPPISALKSMYDSRAYFTTGTMVFENQLKERSGSDIEIVDSSEGIARLHGTHSDCHHHHHHHEHGEDHDHHHHGEEADDEDPHTWTSIPNMRIMARNMLDAMVRIDPAGSDTYQANYRRLDHRLDSLEKVAAEYLADDKGASFMVWHPSLSYFANDYSLHQLSIGLEGKEMSVMGFRQKLDEAKGAGAAVFLLQPSIDAGRSRAIADEAGGISTSTVNTLAYDLPEELVRIAKLISDNRKNEQQSDHNSKRH